jgi:ribosome-associated protein
MTDVPDVGELPDDGMGSDLAVLAARIADEKKATDIVVLDVGEVLAIAGYFVVASASNPRLARTVAESIEQAAKQRLDRSPVRTEGLREQQWILVDYGDVVVHVFVDELREFYEIERLYRDAGRVDWQLPAVTDR